jgi:hypothetical protein
MSIRARAWTALLLPPFLWFLFEQGLSHVLHVRCGLILVGLAWGAASLVGCAIAALMAWSLARRRMALSDVWLARLALVIAGIFSLAIAFQTLAVAMVPPCVG